MPTTLNDREMNVPEFAGQHKRVAPAFPPRRVWVKENAPCQCNNIRTAANMA